MPDGSWFVLRTKPQSEFRAQKELQASGLTTLAPRYRRVSQHARRRVERTEPHLRGYVCVSADCEAVIWREAKNAKHVSEPLMSDHKIARVSKAEIARLNEMDGVNPDAKWTPNGHGFVIGQIVRIAEGPFIGFRGPISYIGSESAKIELPLFGRIARVPVPFAIIEAWPGA